MCTKHTFKKLSLIFQFIIETKNKVEKIEVVIIENIAIQKKTMSMNKKSTYNYRFIIIKLDGRSMQQLVHLCRYIKIY